MDTELQSKEGRFNKIKGALEQSFSLTTAPTERLKVYLAAIRAFYANGNIDAAIDVAIKAKKENSSWVEVHHCLLSLAIKKKDTHLIPGCIHDLLGQVHARTNPISFKLAALGYKTLNKPLAAKRLLIRLVHSYPQTENMIELGYFLVENFPETNFDEILRFFSSKQKRVTPLSSSFNQPTVVADKRHLLAIHHRLSGKMDTYETPANTIKAASKMANSSCHIQPLNHEYWVELIAQKVAYASINSSEQNWTSASRSIKMCLTLGQNKFDAATRASLELSLCECDIWLNRYESARARATSILEELKPSDATCSNAFRLLGRLHIHQGDVPNGIAQYKEALKRNPKNALAWEELSKVYESLSNFEAAELCLKQCTDSSFETKVRIRAWVRLGSLYFLIKKNKSGLEVLGEVLRINPKHAIANFLTGLFYMNARQHKDALGYFNTAGDADPMLPWGPLVISEVDRAQNNLDYAHESAQSMLEYKIPETFAATYIQLAIISEASKNRIQARKFCARALHMHPASEAIRTQLNEWKTS